MRLIAIGLVVLGSILPARADVGPKPRMYAEGMVPRGDMEGLEIEMTAEEVNLTLEATGEKRSEKLVVDAVFYMTNLGDAVEIEEGFPVGPVPNMSKFKVEIDGKPVDFELVNLRPGAPKTKRRGVEDEAGDYWYIWKAKYPARAPSRRVVHYEVGLHHRYYTGVTTSYVLHTGGPWKNAIGKAVVTLRTKNLPAAHIFALSPTRGLSRTGDVWTWTFENLEPTEADNIRIGYDCEETWEEEIERLKPMAEQFLGAKFRMCTRRLEAACRDGRRTMTESELADVCAALKAAVAEAVATETGMEVKAYPSDKYPTTSTRWGEFLFETYGAVVDLAEAHPASVEVAEVLSVWTRLAQALSAGTLIADKQKVEPRKWSTEGQRAAFEEAVKRGSALVKQK
ncbi:MAG: hypothetical protein HUU15_15045 [Candidatus Brocadiae bacterium]|nr:hypothetical protein [Candidatus Brocadiia bacterium]